MFSILKNTSVPFSLQMPGTMNDRKGIFEWIVNAEMKLTHQRFIPEGRITGTPIRSHQNYRSRKIKPLLLDGNYIYSKAPWLSWGELLFGLEKGYIDEKGVSEYVCDALTSSSPKEAVEIASLEVNDYYLVPDLLKSLIGNHSWTESDLAKPWIFLLLFILVGKQRKL
ncbi:hypothetical protein [Pseudomonas prosekii]|uniref:hypothetical protein n=1 Tax=Pseudomonas prosekii TaxID=1148509 RepID=UPI0011B20E57|nr:hypothetical protein [Pseudomonas prosekii]